MAKLPPEPIYGAAAKLLDKLIKLAINLAVLALHSLRNRERIIYHAHNAAPLEEILSLFLRFLHVKRHTGARSSARINNNISENSDNYDIIRETTVV